MKNKSQKVELVANVLIIVVALLLGGVLIQKYFLPGNSSAGDPKAARLQPTVGEKVNLPDENWSGQTKTLVMALQTTCHFCNESAPFYKRVIESVKGKQIKIVAVFPSENEKNISHLKELGLSGLDVRQSELDDIQVSGTPTLILTNDKGEITDFWVGKLPPEKETEVLNKLNS